VDFPLILTDAILFVKGGEKSFFKLPHLQERNSGGIFKQTTQQNKIKRSLTPAFR